MPTEDDLRAALAAIADHAHDTVEPALATASKRHHRHVKRRNLLLPLTSAAIIAAIAVGVVTIADRSGTPTANTTTPVTSSAPAASTKPLPVAGSLPVTRYVFDLNLAGWSSSQVFTSPGAQQIELTSNDGATRATVTLFAPGGWTPTQPADATAITVTGNPGFYGSIQAAAVDLDGEVVPGTLPTATGTSFTLPGALAWQYQPGAWALVYAFAEQKTETAPLTRQQALTIAEAVQPGHTQSIAVPARFKTAPAGLQLQGILTPTGLDAKTAAVVGQQEYSALYSFGPQGTSHTTLIIGVSPATGDTASVTPTVVVGNFRGRLVTRDNLELSDGTTDLSLSSLVDDGSGPRMPESGESVLSLTQLRAIVADMTLAPSIADTSTWFDASTAIG